MPYAHVNCDDSTHTRARARCIIVLIVYMYIHTGGFPNVRRETYYKLLRARATPLRRRRLPPRRRRIHYKSRDDGFTISPTPTPRTRHFRLGFSLKARGYIIILCS